MWHFAVDQPLIGADDELMPMPMPSKDQSGDNTSTFRVPRRVILGGAAAAAGGVVMAGANGFGTPALAAVAPAPPSRTRAYAAATAGAPLQPWVIDRREPGPDDVVIAVEYCGICRSDIHSWRNEWGGSRFPMVPGHEIVGRVVWVGRRVTRFRKGDTAGVGCMVDSCGDCAECRAGLENFCATVAYTYDSVERDGRTPTQGGYSARIVVKQRFVFAVPRNLDPAAAAPLLCAGISTYSPLRDWDCGPNTRVGVLGMGGLGHLAVKLAASMGADVTVLSTSPDKEADARRFGASRFITVGDSSALAPIRNSLDLILDTVVAPHDHNAYLATLRRRGAMVLLAAPFAPTPIIASGLVGGNKRLVGSNIGGVAQTREMLEFCARRGIVAQIERVPVERVNEAHDRLVSRDVRYRFVLDVRSLGREGQVEA